jgi:hypothetical protein
MYIPATFFSTQGSCVIATTTSITGSGTITTGSFISGGFYWDYYQFENTANLTSVSSSFSASLNILSGSTGQAKLLIVAGGGAGGYAAGVPCPVTFASTAAGGGGAGGVVYYNQFPISSGSYEIVVGAGGGNAGGRSGSNSYIKLTNDFVYTPFTSSFINANGGGLGGYVIRPDDCGSGLPKSVSSPITGGSGGGAARPAGFATQAGAISNANGLGGLNDTNQGTNGGGCFNDPNNGIQYDTQGAGGGGSATSGSPANFTPNSNTLTSVGGNGLPFNLTGTSLTYAAGGGGAAGTGFPYTLRTSANGSGTSGFGNGGHADVANFNAGTQATSGVVIIAIPRCTAAFDCKTFAISGSGGTIDYLACTSYGFVTQSTTIPLYDVLNACLTTLSGSNTPLLLNGNYQNATLIGSCDTPQTSSIPSDWPLPYDSCSCLSYTFTAGGSGGTASNILHCGSATSSSISMSAGQQLVLCVNSSSANYFGLSGAGSGIAFNGQCSTGSCPTQAIYYNFSESGAANATFNIYNEGTTIATLTNNASGITSVNTNTYVTASITPDDVNMINRLIVTSGTMSLNITSSNTITPLTASFLANNLIFVSASVEYYREPINLSASVAVSQSLASLYDMQYTQSYSGIGTTVYDISGQNNNATIVSSSYWHYNTSPFNTLMKNTGGLNTEINIPQIGATNYTLLLSWYGKNPIYSDNGIDAPLLYDKDQDPGNNQYGITAFTSSVGVAILNGDTPLNLNVTSSAILDNWHISQISLSTTGTGSYCLDGITGSYTGSGAFSALQFSIFSNKLGDINCGFGSGSMFQVAAVYTSSLSTSQMLSNYNVLKDRYGI